MCPKYLPVGAFLFIMEDMKPRAPQQAHYRKGEYTMKRFAGLYGMKYAGMATNHSEAAKLSKKL